MITLNDVTSRNDYKTLKTTLQNRCEDIAKVIANKMKELDLKTISLNSNHFIMLDRYDYLCYQKDANSNNENRFEYNHVPVADMINFLNHTQYILETLIALETSKCHDIKEALAAAEGID